MPDQVVLRDETGRDHRVILEPDGTAVVGESRFNVKVAAGGAVHVTGPTRVARASEASERVEGSCGPKPPGIETTGIVWTAWVGSVCWVFIDGQVFTFEPARTVARRRGSAAAHHDTLAAPMPATVRKLLIQEGDSVRKHAVLIVLEAMKMELPVRAPADGRVEKINCREGELVQPGVSLIDLETS